VFIGGSTLPAGGAEAGSVHAKTANPARKSMATIWGRYLFADLTNFIFDFFS